MDDKLLTYNISLDTSFFEAQNFLAGSRIADLSSLTMKYGAKLYITDINYREIINRFRKKLIITEEQIKKPLGIVAEKAWLLKNFDDTNIYFDFPVLDISSRLEGFTKKLSTWLKINNVTIIDTGRLTIEKVMNDYFNNMPPFKEGNKKYEFPDAFALNALSKHFKKLKDCTYLLSSDKDLLEYVDPSIIPIDSKDSASLFELVIRNVSEKKESTAIKLIESELLNVKSKLSGIINEEIYKVIEEEINNKAYLRDLEIDGMSELKICDLEYLKHSIPYLDVNESVAGVEYEINLVFEVSIHVIDYSESIYDREDDKLYNVKNEILSINGNRTIAIDLSVEFDLEENIVEFDIESVNNGHDLDIFDDTTNYY